MNKFLKCTMVGALAFTLVGCGNSSEKPEEEKKDKTVTVEVMNGEKQKIEVEFPVDPQEVVVLNWQTMDFLDAVGLGDRVVGLIKEGTYPAHLKKYVEDDSIENVGGMKDIDMEAVMSLQPDVIFSSDRTASKYDEFSKIAPTMSAAVVYADGFMNSYKTLADNHGKIFDKTGEVDDIIAGYEERIDAIAKKAEGQTALLGIFAGGLNTLGNVGRAGIVVNEMGFENLAGDENVNHGNVSSYDAWLEMDPDWMFILDKDTAVGTEAVAAKEQMEVNNPIIAQTKAFKNDQIVYLTPGECWYIADGGITSLDLMITCIEEGIGLK